MTVKNKLKQRVSVENKFRIHINPFLETKVLQVEMLRDRVADSVKINTEWKLNDVIRA